MKAEKLEEKFPRIVVTKISNGFLVTIIPQDKELQKVMQNYVQDIMSSIQNIGSDDADEWKQKMQDSIDRALKAESNDNVKMYACKDCYEVMSYIAPLPEGDELKKGKPDLSWFWSEEGHIAE